MIQNKFIIGLTGSIATGKTKVADHFRRSGFLVICADALAHDAVKPGQRAHRKIVQKFGKSILDTRGNISRKKLGQIVFASPPKRSELEAIIHPEVMRAFQKKIRHSPRKMIVLDVPLLFESGMNTLCDLTLCVATTQLQQISRLRKRDALTRGQAMARIRAHWSQARKIKCSDHVIWNTGSLKDLHRSLKILVCLIKR